MGHRPGLSLRTQGSFGRQSPPCCVSASPRRRLIGARDLLKAESARSTARRGRHSSNRRRTRTHSGGLNDDRHGSGRRDCRMGRGGCATGASETGREVDPHDRADLGFTEEVVEPQGVLHPGRGRSSPAEAVAVNPVETVCHAETVREQRGGTERWGPVSTHQARDRRMVDAGLLGQLTLRQPPRPELDVEPLAERAAAGPRRAHVRIRNPWRNLFIDHVARTPRSRQDATVPLLPPGSAPLASLEMPLPRDLPQ